MKRWICLMLWSMAMLGAALAENALYDLPLDMDFPNYPADSSCFTEDAYHDESLDYILRAGNVGALTTMWHTFR